MDTHLRPIIFIATLLVSYVVAGPTTVCLEGNAEDSITNQCLGCICEASSRCDKLTGCVANGALCGPFLISRLFWIDAGRCTLDGDDPNDVQSWRKCSTDLQCASRIVRSHTEAFAQDCNGDGLITCDDYVMMHRNGAYECSKPIQDTEFWKIYQECKNVITSQGQNI